MDERKDSRFEQLLASYGADRSRWPDGEKAMAGLADGAAEREARTVDAMLAFASEPPVPAGAAARLMDRIAAEEGAEVILFRPRSRPARPLFRFAAALPLAASLALGIYLGAQGSLDFMLPSAVTGGVALNDDSYDDLGGVGEADAYAEENLT